MTIIEGWLLIVDSVSFRLCLSVSFVGQLLAWRFFGGFHSNPFKPIRMHTHTHTGQFIWYVVFYLKQNREQERIGSHAIQNQSMKE